jgi:hypothetical protein
MLKKLVLSTKTSLSNHKKYHSNLLFIAFYFLFFVGMQLTTWLPLRYWAIWGGGNFIDTWQVLRFSDCYKLIQTKVYLDTGPCPGYLYGRPLLHFINFIGVSQSNAQVIGYLLMLTLVLIFAWVRADIQDTVPLYLLLFIMASPPVLLLAERANFDIVIAMLIIVSCKLFYHNLRYLAYLFTGITLVFKFYTAPVMLFFLLLDKNNLRRVIGFILLIICTNSAVADIRMTRTPYPDGAPAQFGFSVWSKYFDLTDRKWFNPATAVSIDIFILVIAAFTLFVFWKFSGLKFIENKFEELSYLHILFLAMTLIHVSCFILGTSYDYRLIYLIIATLLVSSMKLLPVNFSFLMNVNLVFIIFLSYPSGGLQPLGDFLLEIQTLMICYVSLKIISGTIPRVQKS